MHMNVELAAALLAAVAVLAAVADRLDLPRPVVLVAGGLAFGFIPGIPRPRLEPDLVLLVFLPPLVYAAAFLTSPRELAAQAGQISLLSVGLVIATLLGVAVVAHFLAGLPWAASFVLGAVLGPTDPVAATAIAGRLGAPARLTTLLEGEALINDGTALAAYKIAIGAAVAGSFALGSSALRLVGVAAGGIAIGLAAGWLVLQVRRRVEDGSLEVAISLLTPFVAYLPAERAGASGVLAAVAAGLYAGWAANSVVAPTTRLQSLAFWQVLSFVLESALFLLLGLQFPGILSDVQGSTLSLLGEAAAVVAVIFAVRFAWLFLFGIRSGLSRAELTVIGWSGMRGGVSLAAALAIPLQAGDHPFPGRELLLFLTITTVLATLVPPSLTLPWLIERLGLGAGNAIREEAVAARIRVAEAALARLDEAAREEEAPEEALERIRGIYEARLDRLEAMRDEPDDDEDDRLATRPLRRAIVEAEREALAGLRRERKITFEVARDLREDLDLEEARLGKDS